MMGWQWHQRIVTFSGKPFWILLQQEMMGWQWHQLIVKLTAIYSGKDDSASVG